MIIKKIQKNKMIYPTESGGFALLFAVVISSIILAIALGVTNIAFREAKFSSSAQSANDAFFAADTGAECALYYDYKIGITDPFPLADVFCAGNSILVSDISSSGNPNTEYAFIVPKLGGTGQSCAIVTISRNLIDFKTTVVSKGYNVGGDNPNCISSNPNRVERQLEVTY